MNWETVSETPGGGKTYTQEHWGGGAAGRYSETEGEAAGGSTRAAKTTSEGGQASQGRAGEIHFAYKVNLPTDLPLVLVHGLSSSLIPRLYLPQMHYTHTK